jgi:hypothetical protein
VVIEVGYVSRYKKLKRGHVEARLKMVASCLVE